MRMSINGDEDVNENEYAYVVADVGRVEPVWTTGLVCTTHALFRYRAYLRNDFRVVALERNKHFLSSTGHVYTA